MANRYWVGGTGTWDTTAGTKWSTTSGGAGGSAVPTSSDDVFIGNKVAPDWVGSTAYVLTNIVSPTTANGYYYECTTAGTTGVSEPTWPTTAGNTVNDGTAVWTCRLATVTVAASASAKSLDFTNFIGTATFSASVLMYGSLTFVSGMTLTSGASFIWSSMTSGTAILTTAGKSLGSITIAGSGGTLQLADDLTLTVTGNALNGAAGTFSTNNKTVTLTGNNNNVNQLIRGNGYNFTGSNAFYNLIIKPATAASINKNTNFDANIEVTNNLTLDSNSTDPRYRLRISSYTRGTTRTITCNGTVTASYCDFEDITGAGTASWDLSAATGGSGDCGGNSGITFSTPINCYGKGTTKNFSSASVWYASDYSTGVRYPLPQDTVKLLTDGTNRAYGTWTQDIQRIGTIDCSDATYPFTGTLTTSTAATCYGSIILTSGMTLTASTQTYIFAGRGNNTLTNAGKSWAKVISYDMITGSMTITDNFVSTTTNTASLSSGTLTAQGNMTLAGFGISGSSTRTLNMGSGTWEFNKDNNPWAATTTTGLTFNKDSATIKLTGTLTADRTFAGGGLTYNNIWNATSGAFSIIFTGSNTFNQFKSDAGRLFKFTAGTTTTAADWVLTGTAGNNITITSATAASHTLAKSGGGTVVGDYLTISYSTATPANTFYAGNNSTDSGNNSGWIFSTPSTGSGFFFGSNF